MRIKKPLPLPFKIHEVSKSCSHRGSALSGCNSAWSSASDVEFFMRGSIAFQAMWWGQRDNFQNLFLDVDTVKSCSPHRQDADATLSPCFYAICSTREASVSKD